MCVCVCVCVCVCARNQTSLKRLKLRTSNSTCMFRGQSIHDLIKIFRKGAWPGSRDPLIFWALSTTNSETVKATDFKFDVCFQGQSRHDPLKFFSRRGICKNSLAGDMHCHKRLLVYDYEILVCWSDLLSELLWCYIVQIFNTYIFVRALTLQLREHCLLANDWVQNHH